MLIRAQNKERMRLHILPLKGGWQILSVAGRALLMTAVLEPPPKIVPSAGKFVASVFSDADSILMIEEQTINGICFGSLLKPLREHSSIKRRRKLSFSRTILLFTILLLLWLQLMMVTLSWYNTPNTLLTTACSIRLTFIPNVEKRPFLVPIFNQMMTSLIK